MKFFIAFFTLFLVGTESAFCRVAVGRVTSVQQSGRFNKTWELTVTDFMHLHAFKADNPLWVAHFTVSDEKLIPSMKEAMGQMKTVEVYYDQESHFLCGLKSESDCFFLQSFKTLQ